MKTGDIYKKFNIPVNLQEHMVRVAKVAEFICDHWQGPIIYKDLILKMVLVHDLGNVVLLDKEMKEKYGENDHKANTQMLREIGVDEKLITALETKSFGSSPQIAKSADWNLKIVLYSDTRVKPTAITTLKDRLDEYSKRIDDYYKQLNIQDLFAACFEIEAQIQENMTVPVGQIHDEKIYLANEKYLEYSIN